MKSSSCPDAALKQAVLRGLEVGLTENQILRFGKQTTADS